MPWLPSMGRWLTAMQSIDSIPENITYFYGDDDLESTRGPRFQVNSVDERLGIADIAHSKAPKTLRGGHDLSLIKRCTCLDLDRAFCLRHWYVAGILSILLELVFIQTQSTEDLTTHWSLRSDRPFLRQATHSGSDAERIVTTEVFVCRWDD